MHGVEWLQETYQFIMESKAEHYSVLSSFFPLARTPMDQQGSSSLTQHGRNIARMIDDLTPWRKAKRGGLVSDKMRESIGSGNVVVVMGEGDVDIQQFEGARKLKDK